MAQSKIFDVNDDDRIHRLPSLFLTLERWLSSISLGRKSGRGGIKSGYAEKVSGALLGVKVLEKKRLNQLSHNELTQLKTSCATLRGLPRTDAMRRTMEARSDRGVGFLGRIGLKGYGETTFSAVVSFVDQVVALLPTDKEIESENSKKSQPAEIPSDDRRSTGGSGSTLDLGESTKRQG